MIRDRRLGRFRISRDMIDDCPAELLDKIFSKTIILKAEYLAWIDEIEYTGISEYFILRARGEDPIDYKLLCESSMHQDELTHNATMIYKIKGFIPT